MGGTIIDPTKIKGWYSKFCREFNDWEILVEYQPSAAVNL